MNTLSIILVIAIILMILASLAWIPFENIFTIRKKPSTYDSVNFFVFIKPLNDSLSYRVKNDFAPNGTVYQNAVVNFIWDYISGGFILFTCPKLSGTTCDVFRVETYSDGNFSSGWNILNKFQVQESNQYTFGIEDDGKSFYLCDPEKRFLSRFELIPIQSSSFIDPNQTTCSVDNGNGFQGSTKECSRKYLEEILQEEENSHLGAKLPGLVSTWNSFNMQGKPKEVKKTSLKKRFPLTSITVIVIGIIGIVMLAKKLSLCINKVAAEQPNF